jgi:hypothetical protein
MDSSKEKMKRQISLSRAISDAIIAARVNGPIISHPETYKKEEEKIEEKNPMKVVETILVPDQVNKELPIKKEEPPVEKKEKRPPTPPPAPPAASLPAYEPILY